LRSNASRTTTTESGKSWVCSRTPGWSDSPGGERRLPAPVACSAPWSRLPAVAVNPRQARDFAKALDASRKLTRSMLTSGPFLPKDQASGSRPARRDIAGGRGLADATAPAGGDTGGERTAPTRLGSVRRDIEQHIDWLKKRIHDNERDLPKLLATARRGTLGCSCSTTRRASGVYRPDSRGLPARTWDAQPQGIAKLVGIAPLSRDSGTLRANAVAGR